VEFGELAYPQACQIALMKSGSWHLGTTVIDQPELGCLGDVWKSLYSPHVSNKQAALENRPSSVIDYSVNRDQNKDEKRL